MSARSAAVLLRWRWIVGGLPEYKSAPVNAVRLVSDAFRQGQASDQNNKQVISVIYRSLKRGPAPILRLISSTNPEASDRARSAPSLRQRSISAGPAMRLT